MLISKKSKWGISISGAGIAGLLLLFCLSVLFPIVTTGLSNGRVYAGLLAFLLMHGLEPVYWLLCAGILSGGCVLLFDKGSIRLSNNVGIALLCWESVLLLLYFTNGFAPLQLSQIVFFTIWLFAGLAGIIFSVFALIHKKTSRLTPVVFVLGMVIMGLGGFMRLFLTM